MENEETDIVTSDSQFALCHGPQAKTRGPPIFSLNMRMK